MPGSVSVVGMGWWLVGVPSAALWGILAMILRFMPYIGTWISAIFPLILAAAVGPDWSMVIWAASIFVAIEMVVGQFMEPLVQGHSTGLSPVAVIAAATFWTWLWGPIGLVLATPMTIGLVVLGRHVERLNFLDVMFGDQPALTPAGTDLSAAAGPRSGRGGRAGARSICATSRWSNYYETIFVPALKLAYADTETGRLDEDHLESLREAAGELIDDLADHRDRAQSEPENNERAR